MHQNEMKQILKENLYLLSPEERLAGLTIEELEEIIELGQKLLEDHRPSQGKNSEIK